MKTIIILVMISFYNGGVGGNIEVWKDMESCQEEKAGLRKKYNNLAFFACVPVTKEEMENPKGGGEI